MTIALQTCNLGVLLELVGCFSATALAYILPPACYIHLASGRLMERKKLLPVLCMCLGVTVLLLSTSRTVYEAFYHHDDSPNGKDRQWQL
jgi:sodium-coupled neutral amino acid transporter 11